MIQAAVTDIVSPAVAAEHPMGTFHQIILPLKNLIQMHVRPLHLLQSVDQSIRPLSRIRPVLKTIQPSL